MGSVAELGTNLVPNTLLVEEGVTALGIILDAYFCQNHGIVIMTCWYKIGELLSPPFLATPSPCTPAARVVVAWREPCIIIIGFQRIMEIALY